MKKLLNKYIINVFISTCKTKLIFVIQMYPKFITQTLVYTLEGGCCSFSYIYHCDNAEALFNSRISSIESLYTIEDPIQEYGKKYIDKNENKAVIEWGWKITTTKGICNLEFRNESNGYYDGYIEEEKRVWIITPSLLTINRECPHTIKNYHTDECVDIFTINPLKNF